MLLVIFLSKRIIHSILYMNSFPPNTPKGDNNTCESRVCLWLWTVTKPIEALASQQPPNIGPTTLSMFCRPTTIIDLSIRASKWHHTVPWVGLYWRNVPSWLPTPYNGYCWHEVFNHLAKVCWTFFAGKLCISNIVCFIPYTTRYTVLIYTIIIGNSLSRIK
jgi:hypothetical protein